MKIALIISYILIAVLAIIIFMEWKFIQKLTPVPPPTPPANSGTDQRNSNSDKPGSFGDMVDAVKNGAKQLEVKATY